MASKPSFWFSPKGIAALGLIGAVSYFLLMEHRQHLFDYLPILILLACPLMHLFMHGGHGGHGGHTGHGGHQSSDNRVNMDDYRRGYDDALKETNKKLPGKEDNNAR